jgi:hypothetical protein
MWYDARCTCSVQKMPCILFYTQVGLSIPCQYMYHVCLAAYCQGLSDCWGVVKRGMECMMRRRCLPAVSQTCRLTDNLLIEHS